MKYWVRVGELSFEVAVREMADGAAVEIDGQSMQLVLVEGAQGVYTLLAGTKSYEVAAVPRVGGFSLTVDGASFDVEVEDERQRRISSSATTKPVAEGAVAVRAPMPGLVARVDVAEGDQVERGARLVALEAMKMENDITAPRAGRVETVKVSKGETVEQGQLLVLLE